LDIRPLADMFASQAIKTLERLSNISAEPMDVVMGDTETGNPVVEYQAGLYTGPISL
jgi:hypothetical protein